MTTNSSFVLPSLPKRYELDRLLGEGGMGTVYLARDTKLGRPVALKILKPSIVTKESLERFEDEARVCSQLSHPNVVALYDFDKSSHQPFMVFEYIEGTNLRKILLDSAPPKDLLQYLHQVCRGVEAAHKMGIIHRDLKPENVLVANDLVKIADFGLAKLAGVTSVKTKTGVLLGTPHYMSPEQILGKELSPTTDVYSLACIIFEAIEGSPPFIGDNAGAILNAHLKEKVPTLLQGPVGFQTFLKKCLAKSPQERPSVSELTEELSQFSKTDSSRQSTVGIKLSVKTRVFAQKELQRKASTTNDSTSSKKINGFILCLIAAVSVLFVIHSLSRGTNNLKISPIEFDGESCVIRGVADPNESVQCHLSQTLKSSKSLQTRSDENGSFVFHLRGLARQAPIRAIIESSAGKEAVAFTPPAIKVISWSTLRGGPNFVRIKAKMSVPAKWNILLLDPTNNDQIARTELKEKNCNIDVTIPFSLDRTPHEVALSIKAYKKEIVRETVHTGFREISPLIMFKDVLADVFRVETNLVASDTHLIVADSGGFLMGFAHENLDRPPFDSARPTWLKALPLLDNRQSPTVATLPATGEDVSLLYLTQVINPQCSVKLITFSPSNILKRGFDRKFKFSRNGSLLRNHGNLTEFHRREKVIELPYLLSPLAARVGNLTYVLCDGPKGRQALLVYDEKNAKTVATLELPHLSGTRFTISDKYCAVLGEHDDRGNLCVYDRATLRLLRKVVLNGDTNDHVPFIADDWIVVGHNSGAMGINAADEQRDWKYEGYTITCNFVQFKDRIYTVELSRMLSSRLKSFSLSGETVKLANSELPTLGMRKFPMILRHEDTLIVCCEALCLGLKLPSCTHLWKVPSPANLSRYAPHIIQGNTLYLASKSAVWRLCLSGQTTP